MALSGSFVGLTLTNSKTGTKCIASYQVGWLEYTLYLILFCISYRLPKCFVYHPVGKIWVLIWGLL